VPPVEPVFLNIYSASIFHQLMLPPATGRVSGARHVLVTPNSAESELDQVKPHRAHKYFVVIDPFALPKGRLEQIPQPQIWWFIAPLQNETTSDQIRGAAIGKFSNKWLKDYIKPLSYRGLTPKPRLIVSDVSSLETAARLGFQAVVSPPAISDHLFSEPQRGKLAGKFLIEPDSNTYQEIFLKQLDLPERDIVLLRDTADFQKPTPSTFRFGLSLGRSLVREFPILAAAHLASGNALISEPLYPLHGLEPGIDYFEISSPNELFHLTRYLARNPHASTMTTYRGRRKADYFRASRVWGEILSELEL